MKKIDFGTKNLYFPSNFEKHLLARNVDFHARKNKWNVRVFPKNLTKVEKLTKERKNKSLSFPWLVFEGMKKFCMGSIHGLKYARDAALTIEERIFWIIFFFMSMAFCFWNISTLWTTWVSSPFNLIIDDHPTPIYDIPFPAVVICPRNAIKKSVLDIENTTDESLLFMATYMCNHLSPEKYSMIRNLTQEEEINIMNVASKALPPCKEIIKSCSFMSTHDTLGIVFDCCEKFFDPVFTENGLCYGSNMLTDLSEEKFLNITQNPNIFLWDPHTGYDSGDMELEGHEPYPTRVFSAGSKYELTIELAVNASEAQEMCDGLDHGFNIIIDNPAETALVTSFTKIPMNKETTFSLVPRKISTDSALMNMGPHHRKCYFNHERQLNFLRYYTKYNCQLECEMNRILKECRCVPFNFKQYMNETIICNTFKEYKCVFDVKRQMQMSEIKAYYKEKDAESANNVVSDEVIANNKKMNWCGCLLNCDFLTYGMETFSFDLHGTDGKNRPNPENLTTKITIRFKEPMFFGYQRVMTYDNIAFLSQVGGVLSLFSGFSIITGSELLIFVFLKPIVVWAVNNINQFRKNRHLKEKLQQ